MAAAQASVGAATRRRAAILGGRASDTSAKYHTKYWAGRWGVWGQGGCDTGGEEGSAVLPSGAEHAPHLHRAHFVEHDKRPGLSKTGGGEVQVQSGAEGDQGPRLRHKADEGLRHARDLAFRAARQR